MKNLKLKRSEKADKLFDKIKKEISTFKFTSLFMRSLQQELRIYQPK